MQSLAQYPTRPIQLSPIIMQKITSYSRRARQDSWIAFLISLVLHTSLCIFLAFAITIGAGGREGAGEGLFIDASSGNAANDDSESHLGADLQLLTNFNEALSKMLDLTDELSGNLEVPEIQLATANLMIDPNIAGQTRDRALTALDSPQRAGQGTSRPANPTSRLTTNSGTEASGKSAGNGHEGDALNTPGQGSGKEGVGTSASFFGAKAEGKKFIFVIDSSTSMRGERWLALCNELERAIQSLASNQEFFILSFDSQPHPMFGKFPPQGKYLRSTPATLKRVKNWLRSIDLGRRTYPAQAMMIGLRLNPDAIFLLSDGELMDNTVSELRQYNFVEEGSSYSWSVPIHTILLQSQSGYSTLQKIAQENHGTFTPVDVPNQ